MQSIERLGDLSRYGIVPLTGEACGLRYRVLFGVTDLGRRILEKCFSVPKLELEDPWNRGTSEEPHVGSIMLTPEMLPAVGVFALLESGCTEVWRKGDVVHGVEASDEGEWLDDFKREHGPLRRFSYRGTAGDRNVHQMSGRVQ